MPNNQNPIINQDPGDENDAKAAHAVSNFLKLLGTFEQKKPVATIHGGQGTTTASLFWEDVDRLQIITTDNEFEPETGHVRRTIVDSQIVTCAQCHEIEDDEVRHAAISLFTKKEIERTLRQADAMIRMQLGGGHA